MGRLRGCRCIATLILIVAFATFVRSSYASVTGKTRVIKHSYVAACVLAKNEHRYIREFIQYHHWIGINKFYVWDHQSQPALSVVLEDYVLSSLVEVFYFSDSWKLDEKLHADMYKSSTRQFLSPQGWAYDNCFRMFGHRHTFMLLIDPDEYVILKEPPIPGRTAPDITNFLSPFEPYGGLMVHWQLIGPSGHMHRPNGSTLASYTQCMTRHVMQNYKEFRTAPLGFAKSITSTRCYRQGCNPHLCELKPGCKYVNEQYMDLTGRNVRAVHWDRIVIFHFVTRSAVDYKAKMDRGSGHSQFYKFNRLLGRTHRGWRYFRSVNSSCTGTCVEGQAAWTRCAADGFCKAPVRGDRAAAAAAAAAVRDSVAAAVSTAAAGTAAAGTQVDVRHEVVGHPQGSAALGHAAAQTHPAAEAATGASGAVDGESTIQSAGGSVGGSAIAAAGLVAEAALRTDAVGVNGAAVGHVIAARTAVAGKADMPVAGGAQLRAGGAGAAASAGAGGNAAVSSGGTAAGTVGGVTADMAVAATADMPVSIRLSGSNTAASDHMAVGGGGGGTEGGSQAAVKADMPVATGIATGVSTAAAAHLVAGGSGGGGGEAALEVAAAADVHAVARPLSLE